MILPLVLATCVLLHIGITDVIPKDMWIRRLVGGKIVPYNKHTFNAAILITKGRVATSCCGSIIADRWILTAGHCMEGARASDVTVHTGHNRYASGERHQVRHVLIHPEFDGDNNDIALLHLQTIISKGTSVELATTNTPMNTKCTITGWGVTNMYASARSDPALREVDVYTTRCYNTFIVDPNNLERFNENSTVCTSTSNGEGACLGDSGGPLVIGNVQIGIVSNGEPCALGVPDVYTNVAFYRLWIHNTMLDYNYS